MNAVVAGMAPWVGVVQLPTRSAASRGPSRNVVAPPCEDDDPAPSVPADVVLAACEDIGHHADDVMAVVRGVRLLMPETADILEHAAAGIRRSAAELGTRAAGASS